MKSTRSRLGPISIGLALLAIFGLSADRALAQGSIATTRAPSSWTGYAPGQGWVTYSPYPVAPVPPAVPPTNVAPAPARPRTNAWTGYAPARSWSGYNPGSAWGNYQPGRSAQAQARPVVPQPGVSRSTMPVRPAHHREHGTGRNLHMHKPWAP